MTTRPLPLETAEHNYYEAAIEYYWHWRKLGFNMQYPYSIVVGQTPGGRLDYEYRVNWLGHSDHALHLRGFREFDKE